MNFNTYISYVLLIMCSISQIFLIINIDDMMIQMMGMILLFLSYGLMVINSNYDRIMGQIKND